MSRVPINKKPGDDLFAKEWNDMAIIANRARRLLTGGGITLNNTPDGISIAFDRSTLLSQEKVFGVNRTGMKIPAFSVCEITGWFKGRLYDIQRPSHAGIINIGVTRETIPISGRGPVYTSGLQLVFIDDSGPEGAISAGDYVTCYKDTFLFVKFRAGPYLCKATIETSDTNFSNRIALVAIDNTTSDTIIVTKEGMKPLVARNLDFVGFDGAIDEGNGICTVGQESWTGSVTNENDGRVTINMPAGEFVTIDDLGQGIVRITRVVP